MNINTNITETLALVGQLAPSSLSAAAHNVGPFPLWGVERLFAVINVGALGSSATVTAQFQAATSEGGSYVAITGTTISTISSGSTNIVLLECKIETITSQNQNFTYGQLTITVGTAASQVSAEVFSTNAYQPASTYEQVTPTQILVA
jgi:hypothetical protein